MLYIYTSVNRFVGDSLNNLIMSFDQIHVLMFYMPIEYRYLLYAVP